MKSGAVKALAVSLVLFAIEAWGAEMPPSMAKAALPDSPLLLAQHVRNLFAANCLDCHGAHLPKPKGKFGYVLDLTRMAQNPKMVIPGNSTDSELYQMILNDEMPGKKSGLPKLTDTDKETVRRWIEVGAPDAPAVAAPAPAAPRLTLPQRIVRDLGHLHPLATHFPVALLFVTLPAELIWLWTRREEWKSAARFCVAFGALGAVAATGLGWCNAVFTSYTGVSEKVLEWHRWLGTGTAAWAVALLIVSELAHRSGQPRHLRVAFRTVLVVGLVMVGTSGYLGASLVYGLDHFTL